MKMQDLIDKVKYSLSIPDTGGFNSSNHKIYFTDDKELLRKWIWECGFPADVPYYVFNKKEIYDLIYKWIVSPAAQKKICKKIWKKYFNCANDVHILWCFTEETNRKLKEHPSVIQRLIETFYYGDLTYIGATAGIEMQMQSYSFD